MSEITPEEAVARLDAIGNGDPEGAHSEAEDVLLELAPREVQEAFIRVMERQPWWAHA